MTDNIYRTAIEAEIRECRAVERWYRQHGWADWPDLRRENKAALRSLLKVARLARKVERATPDPITEFKGWSESHVDHEILTADCPECAEEMALSYWATVGRPLAEETELERMAARG